jgi:hypothetical protein
MKWEQGTYQVKNRDKYIGRKLPIYRSSWERRFCIFCDTHPSIIKWSSESLKIPYMNPLTNKVSNYVPDFLIQYIDAEGVEHTELIEIKPRSQTTFENAGRSQRNQAAVVVNSAKWQAAQEWCDRRGINFKVLNEDQIFSTQKKRNPHPRKR